MIVPIYHCRIHLLFFLSGSFSQTLWTRDAHFHDVLPKGVSLESSILVRSKIQCALRCKKQHNCTGFVFSQTDNHCLLASQVCLYSGTEPLLPGAQYYRIRPLTCPADRDYVLHEQSGTCFQLNIVILNWTSARDTCQKEGGRLAVLDTPGKEKALMNFFRANNPYVKHYNIGGHRPYDRWNTSWLNGKQDFIWLNGQPVVTDRSSGFWYPSEPDNHGANQNTLIIYKNGNWYLGDTFIYDNYYVCEFALL